MRRFEIQTGDRREEIDSDEIAERSMKKIAERFAAEWNSQALNIPEDDQPAAIRIAKKYLESWVSKDQNKDKYIYDAAEAIAAL